MYIVSRDPSLGAFLGQGETSHSIIDRKPSRYSIQQDNRAEIYHNTSNGKTTCFLDAELLLEKH